MIAELSVGDWLGIGTAVVAGLSFLCGGVWWMSALYSNVKAIRDAMSEYVHEHKEDKDIIWKKINEHSDTLQNHSGRLIVLENRVK